jgi:hypothetical protein
MEGTNGRDPLIAAHADNMTRNKNTAVFTKAWLPKKGFKQQSQMLTKDPDMVLFAADPSKKLMALRSFKNAGGTLLCQNKKLMCLSGPAFVFDPSTLIADCPLVPQTIDALHKCKAAIKVEEIEAPSKSGLVAYPEPASFLPAPWLADAVTAANSSIPFNLITVINKVATAFDQEHNNNKNSITSVAEHSGDFIN